MKALKIFINLLEDDLIELVLSASSSNVDVYYSQQEWEAFKKAVNEFHYSHELGKRVNVRSTIGMIHFWVDQDGTAVDLTFTDGQNMPLISFTEKQFEKFKKKVNEWRISE